MSFSHLGVGDDMPHSFNTVIEIAADGGSIKYEVDKASGLLMVDRFMPVAMHYPCNYGYVPGTLGEDGDPMDVLVMTPYPVQPGCLMRVRALGVLIMTDEAGKDSKILAVPIEKACVQYANMQSLADVPELLLKKISHFFEQYKALEVGKWVKVEGWQEKSYAMDLLESSIQRGAV